MALRLEELFLVLRQAPLEAGRVREWASIGGGATTAFASLEVTEDLDQVLGSVVERFGDRSIPVLGFTAVQQSDGRFHVDADGWEEHEALDLFRQAVLGLEMLASSAPAPMADPEAVAA